MMAGHIAAALGKHSSKSGGGFMACCPAHDDKTPSLAIDQADDGSLLVKCFAGCSQDEVVTAMKSRGLWQGQAGALSTLEKPVTRQVWKPILPVPGNVNEPDIVHPQYGKPSTVWRYLSADGGLLQIICRFDSDNKKQILPLTWCGNGHKQEWRWQGLPAPRPLYGLDVLGNSKYVVVVEGEKAADAGRRMLGGLPIITWPGGSNAVAKADWKPLAEKSVAIWPDADKAGIKAAIAVALELKKNGVESVKIVEPPKDVLTGWDLADAEDEGWDGNRVREELKAGLLLDEFVTRHGQLTHNQEKTSPQKQIRVVNIEELLEHEFPPRENILSPWLPSQGVAMVYAGRGIGKTFFSLSVGLAVSSGGSFLKWQSEQKKPVLLLDGEMPGAVLQERAAAFIAAQDLPPGDFRIVTPDMQPDHRSIDLSKAEDQELIEQHLDGVGLIIVDNISTLCRTGRENEGEGWLPVQEWALRQRAKGRSVLFIHHAGKGGNQRGTSRREDILDTVIALRRPAKYTPDMGAVFEVHFEKSRGIYGEDVEAIEASLIAAEDGLLTWSYRSVDVSTYDKVVELLKEGLSVTEIATELEINKSTASRHARKAKSNGDCNG